MYTESETGTPPASSGAAAEAFLRRTCDIIDAGAQAVMISIGHRSGLFDVMAGLEPATSKRIPDHAGLAERYVREWLAVRVTADIVDYAPQGRTYRLPAAHAKCLTRSAGLGNAAVFAQHAVMIGALQLPDAALPENR